jgi:cation:H+ antiporter
MNSAHLWGNEISRSDGLVLLVGFALFMLYSFIAARRSGELVLKDEYLGVEEEKLPVNYRMVAINAVWIIVGLACLIVGSNIFVDGATYVAHRYNVRQSVIGLTIVAGGTSLPELATSIVAAYKGKAGLAIGNAIGSNVFNIFLILGLTAVISPLRIMGITIIDLMMMLVSIGFLWLFAYTKYFVSRKEGVLLVLAFFAYMAWLFYLL